MEYVEHSNLNCLNEIFLFKFNLNLCMYANSKYTFWLFSRAILLKTKKLLFLSKFNKGNFKFRIILWVNINKYYENYGNFNKKMLNFYVKCKLLRLYNFNGGLNINWDLGNERY